MNVVTFVEIVRNMRHAQVGYFRSRSTSHLVEAKGLEKLVDEALYGTITFDMAAQPKQQDLFPAAVDVTEAIVTNLKSQIEGQKKIIMDFQTMERAYVTDLRDKVEVGIKVIENLLEGDEQGAYPHHLAEARDYLNLVKEKGIVGRAMEVMGYTEEKHPVVKP